MSELYFKKPKMVSNSTSKKLESCHWLNWKISNSYKRSELTRQAAAHTHTCPPPPTHTPQNVREEQKNTENHNLPGQKSKSWAPWGASAGVDLTGNWQIAAGSLWTSLRHRNSRRTHFCEFHFGAFLVLTVNIWEKYHLFPSWNKGEGIILKYTRTFWC